MMSPREVEAEAGNVAARMDALDDALEARDWHPEPRLKVIIALAEGGFFNQQKFVS